MSVISVDENFAGRRGSISGHAVYSYTRVFNVQTDSELDGPQVVLSAEGIPQFYAPYSSGNDYNPAALAKSITPQISSDCRTFWTVTVEYDTALDQSQQNQANFPNPTDRPIQVSYTSATYTIPVLEDIDGLAANKNNVGDTFDPPLTQEVSRPVLQITKNQADFDPAVKYDYENAINSDEFQGAAAKTVLCRRIDAQLQFENVPGTGQVPFWQVTYVFEHNRDQWNPVKVLNEGYNQLNAGGDIIKIILKNDQVPSSPQRLGSDGKVLTATADDYFLEKHIYREVSFASLNLE